MTCERCKDLERQLAETRKRCTCDDPGDGRCPQHGRECDLQDESARLREALERYKKAYKEATDGMDMALTKLPSDTAEASPFSARCKILKAMLRARETLAGDGGQEVSE